MPLTGHCIVVLRLIYTHRRTSIISYIGSYLKAVRVIPEIWNRILCFTMVLKPQLQPEVANHCLYTVQTALNFAAGSFFCKITLIWQDSSLSIHICLKRVMHDHNDDK